MSRRHARPPIHKRLKAASGRLQTAAGALALALICPIGAAAFAGATFQGIGDLPGGVFYSLPYGVSADGSTVIGHSVSASGNEGFRWSASSGIAGLGDLPGGVFWSDARAVNADGSVVVGLSLSGNGTEAFRWSAASGMVGLGDLAGGAFSSEAWAVSADGSVVAGRGRSTASGSNWEAFRWDAANGITGLGDLAGGSFASTAGGVSGDGSVIVGFGSMLGGTEAFRWSSAGMVGIGHLPGSLNTSVAHAISADGSVIVGWGSSTGLSQQAFRWDAVNGVVGLGVLPGGGFVSSAHAVSADGSVIVGQSNATMGAEAVLWDATHGIRRIKDVLVNDHGLALQGWKLERATGISADGRVIVGWGRNPGNQTEGWIAAFDGCAQASNQSYGAGKPGSTGTPVLDAVSLPVLGQDAPIRITGALPGALPFLVLGPTAAALPLDGGTLHVTPLLVLSIPVPIAGDGTLLLPGVLPADPSLCGFELYHQALYVDPGAAGFHHLALTNGLRRTLGVP